MIPVTDEYELLWTLADEMVAKTGEPAEKWWLRIMNSALPLYVISKNPSTDPRFSRERVVLPVARDALAGLLNADIRGWELADYLGQPEPFRSHYFARPDSEGLRLGMAVRRDEFQRWCPEQPAKPLTRDEAIKKRLLAGERPGENGTITMPAFQRELISDSGRPPGQILSISHRGYDLRTLRRIVPKFLKELKLK